MRIKSFILLTLFAFLLLINGCATRVIYKEVKVPIKCNIDLPKKPLIKETDLITSFKEFLIYSEVLEEDLKFCVGIVEDKKESKR